MATQLLYYFILYISFIIFNAAILKLVKTAFYCVSSGMLFIFNFLCVILFHISMPMRGDSKGSSSACVVHCILMTLTENMVPLLWPWGLKGPLYWYNCDHKAKPVCGSHSTLLSKISFAHYVRPMPSESWRIFSWLMMSNRSWMCSSCPLCKPQLFFSGAYSWLLLILKGY